MTQPAGRVDRIRWCFLTICLAGMFWAEGMAFSTTAFGAGVDEGEAQRIEEELIARLDELEEGLPPMEADSTPFRPASCEDIDESVIPEDLRVKLRRLGDPEVECVYKTLFAAALARKTGHDLMQGSPATTPGDPTGPPPILWNGQSCGCVPAVNQIVYGFYPAGMAEGTEQLVDFSVLSRIGYESLTFDENGNFIDFLHWKKEKPYSNFVNEAHRYRTKIDVVVSNHNWDKWGEFTPGETSVVIDKLSGHIVSLVNVPLDNDWLNVLKPYISFGYSPMRTLGDGVTIHFNFDGLSDKDPAMIFSSLYKFINTLRGRLDHTNGLFSLNMIVPFQDVVEGKGVYHLSNLKKMADDVNVFLVTIPEPIDQSLKQLRGEIERRFSSKEQQAMVRKMVPILSPKMPLDSLQDGLVYIEDNFGGVGLSTIPLVGEGQADAVNQALKSFLHSEDGVVCQVVCSNRWTLRAIIFFIGMFGISYGLLAIGLYDLRNFYATYSRYFLGMALLTVILLALTFSCDPFWKDRQSELLFLGLIVGGGILIWKLQKRKEGTYP